MKKLILLDSFTVWLYYPTLIKWKIAQRDLLDPTEKDFLISTINSSILIDLTTFSEGIIYEIQSTVFFDRYDSNDEFQFRTFKYFDDKLNNSTWSNYIETFELILGEKLSTKIESELWKSISMLFNFRNSLVHGKEIEIHYYEENGKLFAESPKKLKNVFQYLKEKKLIDLTFYPNLNSVDLLNNLVVDHFFETTLEFIKKLFEILPESEVGELKINFDECLKF